MAARSRWIHRSLGVAAVLVLLSMGATPGANAAGDERPVLTFGSLMDPSQTGGTERLLGLMHQEIEALIRRDYDVRFPKTKRRTSDWTAEGISHELDDLLADSEVDMILVIGPFSTAALCCYPELPKPVFAPLGIDAAALGLPDDGNTSGVRNLNYLNNPGAALRDLEAFREIVGYQTVYIVSDPLIYEVLTELYERNQRFLESMGLTIVPVFAATSAYDVLDRLPDGAEAVYFTPLLRMSDDELRKLIDGLNARKIPTMSLIGRSEVEMGMLAGLRAPTDYPRMARRIALNVQQALFGEDPGTFSTIFERSERLVINMDTAREIGRYPTCAGRQPSDPLRPARRGRGTSGDQGGPRRLPATARRFVGREPGRRRTRNLSRPAHHVGGRHPVPGLLVRPTRHRDSRRKGRPASPRAGPGTHRTGRRRRGRDRVLRHPARPDPRTHRA
jgi:ABC-type uncharacterized transport system substrate-binding protein